MWTTKKGRPTEAGRPSQRDEDSRRVIGSDRLKVQSTRGAVVRACFVGETLADGRETVLVPSDRALLEANEIAADFRLDFALALDRVE